MRTNGTLQKHYDKLAPRERLALIFAAIAREDETERQVLIETAPRLHYSMPDYLGEANAFNYLCLVYLAKQLELAWSISTLAHFETPNAREEKRMYNAACMTAYIFCTRAEAWRAFCAGLEIDAGAALKQMPGAETVAYAEQFARMIAFTVEEARAHYAAMAERLELHGEMVTLETATAELGAMFEQWAKNL